MGRAFAFRFQSAVMPLLVINIIMFLVQQILGPWFTESFMLVSGDVLARPWILLTSMFLHANTLHLIFNMYALFLFGSLIEQRIGPRRFLLIYLVSGLVAGAAATQFYQAALGASGAVTGILGVTIMLMPDLRVLLFFAIPMSLRTAGIIFAIIEVFGVFTPSGVANIAHLVGLGCGLAYGYYLLKKKRKFSKRFHREDTRCRSARGGAAGGSMEMNQEDIDDYLRYGRI